MGLLNATPNRYIIAVMEQTPWIFWLIVAVLSGLVAAALVAPLLRRPRAGDAGDAELDIYKSQLAEIDRDLERGVLDRDEAERTRTEISRRLLAADRAGARATSDAPSRLSQLAAGLMIAAILAAAVGGYLWLGAPGYPDMPRAERIAAGDEMRRDRISQLEAEAQNTDRFAAPLSLSEDIAAMIEELREIVPTRPDDLRGWTLLATNEARLRNYAAAAEAQARVIALRGDEVTETDRYLQIHYLFMAANGEVSPDLQSLINTFAPDDATRAELWQALAHDARAVGQFQAATRAQERRVGALGDAARIADYTELLDYMVSATNGYVSPEAETIAVRILQQDPENPAALYYAGLLYAQTNRPDRAFSFLRRVVETAEPTSLHYLLASSLIEDVAWRAGVDYSLPERPERGPSAADIAAAEDMSAEDRQQMIENMVASLSDRLARSGGSPEEWAQLIRALGVLGESGRARAIWQEARQVFGRDDAALVLIDDAANAAGLSQ